MNSKGIFNIEMLISLMLLLIIMAMLISIAVEEFSSIEETQNRKEARIITMDIVKIINKVYINGENYSEKYKLPEKINNETYIIQINKSGVYLNSHYQMTHGRPVHNVMYNPEKITLERGNVYEFINNNNSITIIQLY